MQEKDVNFVICHLDEYEKTLFFKLTQSEQKHCIRVATQAIKMVKEKSEYKDVNIDRIIKAALLHDIGKGYKKINVMEKVIMVLATKIFGDKVRRYESFEFVDSYYNHGNMSYNILKSYIKDEKLLFLIKNHHSKINGDIELDLLKYCDDRN